MHRLDWLEATSEPLTSVTGSLAVREHAEKQAGHPRHPHHGPCRIDRIDPIRKKGFTRSDSSSHHWAVEDAADSGPGTPVSLERAHWLEGPPWGEEGGTLVPHQRCCVSLLTAVPGPAHWHPGQNQHTCADLFTGYPAIGLTAHLDVELTASLCASSIQLRRRVRCRRVSTIRFLLENRHTFLSDIITISSTISSIVAGGEDQQYFLYWQRGVDMVTTVAQSFIWDWMSTESRLLW